MGKYDRYSHGANTWKSGDYYVVCDVCGFKLPASKARMRWDKALVCPEDFEFRHPQEFLRSQSDRIKPDGPTRPEVDDTFLSTEITQEDL